MRGFLFLLFDGTFTIENQYFIPSNADFTHFVTGTRRHWRIENTLHWNRNVVYGEDKIRIQKENAPSNSNVFRKASISFCAQKSFPKNILQPETNWQFCKREPA